MDPKAMGRNVTNLKSKAFAEAKAARIEQGEVGVKARLGELDENVLDLLFGKNDRKRLAMFDDDLVKDGPGRNELEMVQVESAQSDLGLIHRTRLVLLLGTKKDKVITELILGEDLRIEAEMAPK